ncbi:MAG: tRNA dimethylallyltransferase [Acidimicrobiales bacterium]|nr:MAG: tRNA dimethylallyltransferase [Acidimicrobiales bacterium]
MTNRADHPLVVLGPTASGKSALALAIAETLGDVELVSVDSMQVYRGMDVGTASPTAEERARVRHHLVDLVDADTAFTVGEFQRHARDTLADIRARGRVPLLVGGTGLYLRAVVDDLELPGRFPDTYAALDAEPDTARLHAQLASQDPVAAGRMEPTNRRRILRALEVTVGSGRPFSSYGPGMEEYGPSPFVQVALRWPRDVLDRRIAERYERQLEGGFLDEVRRLADLGPSRTAAQALGYRELLRHVAGELSLEDAVHDAILRTRRFARRQERWFRRDPRITWIDMPVEPAALIEHWRHESGLRGA